ncbi:phage portal protein [Paenibacillus sp. ACRRY]|uniref:phage tail assembly chaperone n=1 Tax=Paenibacillus sp. ACRRY TaxID=2918208 RepID=UPI001EF4CAA2|nr:phage portal protein [Paenibacillus sp. ACRRY]MCG7385107.1 phage portal protein [Paenibacillus sp. ACRRY]
MTQRNMAFFMKGNAKPIQELEEVVTRRYLDEEGEPVPFVFRPLGSERVEELRDECTKRIPARKGTPAREEFDARRFNIKVGIETTVFPNFKDAELLKSYGVTDPVDVVPKVLETAGEMGAWFEAMQKANDFDDDFEELIEDAKN